MERQLVTMLCGICKGGFFKNKKESQLQWGKRRFCSAKCTGTFNQGNLLGRKSGRIPSEKVRQAARLVGLANKKVLAISMTLEYRRWKCNERYARKIGAPGSFTLDEWEALKRLFEYRCAICASPETVRKLTIDHITPLTRGGSNFIANIQPLCQPCNSRKGNR